VSAAATIDTTAGPHAGTEQLNHRVARTLRIGVVASALLFATAVAVRAAAGGSGLLTRAPALSGASLADAASHPSAVGFALWGAILLAATPLVRVALSCEFFAAHRDRSFTGLTLFVLSVLLVTIAVGVLR
jgi:uncharacterized membrane protein